MPNLAFSLFLVIYLALVGIVATKPTNHSIVPGIFVFGDSLVDVGNHHYLNVSDLYKAQPPLYGIDLPKHIRTARFSNGYNGIDFIAMELGFENSPPPYLSIRSAKEFKHGVNFASAGSGILNCTGDDILTMATQVKYFATTTRAIKQVYGSTQAKSYLEKSLVVICTGSNDLFAYYSATGAMKRSQNKKFISYLVDKFVQHLKMLHIHGLRKFGILGTASVGCVPYFRSRNPSGRCIQKLNQLSSMFDKTVKQRIQQLSEYLPSFQYSFVDPSQFPERPDLPILMPVISTEYGPVNISAACCGKGRFNGGALCNRDIKPCKNRTEYMYWDWFHPTEAVYRLSAYAALYGPPSIVTPMNFQKLVLS